MPFSCVTVTATGPCPGLLPDVRGRSFRFTSGGMAAQGLPGLSIRLGDLLRSSLGETIHETLHQRVNTPAQGSQKAGSEGSPAGSSRTDWTTIANLAGKLPT